jgi:hypothetical protein
MKPGISSMKKRFNSWREKPLVVPVTTSAQSVLRGIKNVKNHSSSCKASCGSECEVQTCVSCKVEG